MKDIKDITTIYFIGIGGIGMSALARYFNAIGKRVYGYDKTETGLTKQLIKEGMQIQYSDDSSLIDSNVDTVVYTPAIPKDLKVYKYFLENNYTLLKRSDILGIITGESYNICVAGTHGKTTTSAMIAHILRDSGFGCNAFLGGIASNYDTNFWSSENNVCVVEADEYDRSFLKLKPDVAVITAMDPDHLDIYGTERNMQDAFIAFTGKIKNRGFLISKYGLSRSDEFEASKKCTYSVGNTLASAKAENMQIIDGSYLFDVEIDEDKIANVKLNMGGMHNVENAIAAITVARYLDIPQEKIKSALAGFRGVKRRFEYIVKERDTVLIDDYAHHPEELRVLIEGAKELFPQMKCTVVFQPHLYSRTRDLADEFAKVLSMADETLLLPIYPARELPIEGVSSKMILDKMINKHKNIVTKAELLDWVKNNKPELLIISGAGDIDMEVLSVKSVLTGNKQVEKL